MKGKYYFTLLGWIIAPVWANPAPTPLLIDMVLQASAQGPKPEPLQLNFEQGQEYLLVITNESINAINLYFEAFGQKVFTYYLQGTPNVSQESLGIPGQAKVLWHFAPQQSGEFVFYASESSHHQQGPKGKMVIKALSPPPVVEPSTQQQKSPGPTSSTSVTAAFARMSRWLKRQ